MTRPEERKLYAGQLGVAIAELVGPDPDYDIHITAILVHNSHATLVRWFEIWALGLRVAREALQPGDTLNIIEEVRSKIIMNAGVDNIEGLAEVANTINVIVNGYKIPKTQ